MMGCKLNLSMDNFFWVAIDFDSLNFDFVHAAT